MNSFENKYTNPSETLYDNDPAVSIDIDVRDTLNPGEVVNVDYAALEETLRATGATPNNKDLSIRIQKPTKGFGGMRGSYSVNDNTLNIRLNRDQYKTQKVLQHELRHYSDFRANPETTGDQVQTVAGNIGGLGTTLFSFPLLGATLMKAAEKSPKLSGQAINALGDDTYNSIVNSIDHVHSASTALTIGSLTLMGAFYYGNKRERIARNAEKLDLPQVISVDQSYHQ